MKSDRWQAIEGLFHAARELEGDDRTSFLDRECSADGAMRRQVEALLAHTDNANGFLETPVLALVTQKDSPALNVGQELGIYTIVSRLGSGGMGEVYRAHDATLRREVAIKVLPVLFTNDLERLRRIEREARVVASLNHPNIAAIYSIGEANGSRFLVLELVEGETLAERIQSGALPIDEALHIARGICEALEAAHEKGVIHHDLKPANVKVTPEGIVKVLDFGLAKATENTPAWGNLSQSPIARLTATQAGVILGTAAYMSPEQAKGLKTDQRSDIFSFGAVLYEILTGRQAFQGDTVSEVLASILAREPDFGVMPPNVNPKILALLRRSLEKNPKHRWYAIGDLRVELEAVLADPRGTLVEKQRVATSKPLWKRALPVFAAVVLTAAITSAGMWYFRPSPLMKVTRLSFPLAEGQKFTNAGRSLLALSADGTQLVYVANQKLYLKPMSESEARPISGTETWQGAVNPVFSPDGRFLVFWSVKDEMLMTIAVTGGTAAPLCRAENPFGISWGEDGIVFGQGDKGIMRVKDGGTPELLVGVKPGEFASGPQILPGGQVILYTLAAGNTVTDWKNAEVFVQSLKPGSVPKPILKGGSDARYVSTEHIVYAVEGTLYAIPFDLQLLQPTGGRVPVVKGVLRGVSAGIAQFSFSSTGDLAYIPGPETAIEYPLAVMGRKEGEALELLKFPMKSYGYPRSSADGKSVAFSTEDGANSNVWIYDRGGARAPHQLTSGSMNRYPIWADNERVAFQSNRDGDLAIFWQRADGLDTATRLTTPKQGVEHIPDSWSPDGQSFSFTAVKGSEGSVWIYSFKNRMATVFAEKASVFIGRSSFSPGGHWLAYQASEVGKGNQIIVQKFPSGAQYPLLSGGHPVWSPDPNQLELFYTVGAGRISVVSIRTQPTISHGVPMPLPDGLQNRKPDTYPRYWDVLDGEHLIGVPQGPSGTSGAPQIQVVLHWFEDLKRQMSTH